MYEVRLRYGDIYRVVNTSDNTMRLVRLCIIRKGASHGMLRQGNFYPAPKGKSYPDNLVDTFDTLEEVSTFLKMLAVLEE